MSAPGCRPLRVLQILPELDAGGVERGTLEIAQALKSRGHHALVVSGGGRLERELKACGATHLTLPVGEKKLRSLRLIRELERLFVGHQVDLVHARSRLPAWLAWLALRRIPLGRRPAWVTTVHGPYTVNSYSRIMTTGDRVIAISDFIRDYIACSYPGVPTERIVVIPRGIDHALYNASYEPSQDWVARWKAEHPALLDKPLLILPARLTRWKGQEDFLRVLAGVRSRGVDAHGLLVGAAHQRKPRYLHELQTLSEALGVKDQAHFLGHREDIRELLSISRVAFSLTGEPEAFGRTTIEALSLGVPVVGYSHGGTREILEQVLSAGLVPRGDIAAVVARTLTFLASPPAPRTEHPFTLPNMQRRTLALYEELSPQRVSTPSL